MTVNAQVKNVKLGPCNVTFGGQDLGLTKGGVTVAITTNKHEVMVDQFGQTAVNDYITGRTGTVKVPMAETDIAKLALVIPGATIVTDATTPTKKKLLIPTSVGLSLLDSALELTLHPTQLPDTDHSEDVTIPLASPAGSMEFSFQVENERVYNIDFQMYPDEDGLIAIIGDPSAED